MEENLLNSNQEQSSLGFSEPELSECRRLIEWGIREDLGDPPRDLTTDSVIEGEPSASAVVVARQKGVVAGLPALPLLAASFQIEAVPLGVDGPTEQDAKLARLMGPIRKILAMERLLLNLLCRLSGVASLTKLYVDRVAGTKAVICDTRKTTPGWRHLEKYAVRIGGGTNHRLALYDGVLIKDNHLAELAFTSDKPIAQSVLRARSKNPVGTIIEVEVDTLAQLEEALSARPDIVLLDNMNTVTLGLAVEMRNLLAPTVRLEASGGVNLQTVSAIARTGVDRISVGALTHSAIALDLALDYETHLP